MTPLTRSLARFSGRLALGALTTAAAALLVVPSALATPESDAADAIEQAWQSAGGADSPVGGKDGDVFAVGTGYGQKFADGKILFTPDTGAHLIYGAVLDKYESLGGAADSDLGFPTINTVAGLVGPKSRVSTFSASDKPAVFWTPDTGAWAVRGAINAAWDKLGGSAGKLGVPTEDERYDGDVVSQKFTGGELAWNKASNTFTTDPPDLADRLVGLEVPLDPTTLINLAWRASGGLGGQLGARQGEQTTIGDNGAAQGYAGGKIFYSPQTGAQAVTGAILSKYESLGGPTGDLGFPTGTESEGGVPNSRVSSFSAADKPVIFWTPDSGAIVVRGAINAAWDKLGGATGTLGVPTGEQTVNGDTVTQVFSGGQISWDNATKEFSTKPAELAADLKGLELPDAVAQTPAGTAPAGKATASSWHWWWLAIIIPVLILLGLLAMWAQRRSAAPAERFEPGSDERWSGHDEGVSSYSWSGSGREDLFGSDAGGDFSGDEDAIDTAPTRIPTDAELGEYGESPEWGTAGSGRHSAEAADGPGAAWQLDLGEIGRPRHRHAAEDEPSLPSWSIPEPPRWDVPADPADFNFGENDYGTERFGSGYADTGYVEAGYVEFESTTPEPPSPFEEHAGGRFAEVVDEEPWRPAIHLPLADPYQAPEGYFIKANTHSGLYYTPDSVLYDNTLPEVWFASEDVAQANGFVRAPE